MCQAAQREGAHLTAASSSSVYGSVPDLPRRENLATRPMSPYAVTKLATESYLARLRLLLRPADAALPVQRLRTEAGRGHVYAAVIPVFLDAALRCWPLPLNGDGLQSRDFTFVDTVTWVLADAKASPRHL